MSIQRIVSFFRCLKILYHQQWLSCTESSEGLRSADENSVKAIAARIKGRAQGSKENIH